MAVAPVRVQVIEEVTPFGDVPLAPAVATGRSEAELARVIAGLTHESARLPGIGALTRGTSRPRPDDSTRKRAA